MREVRFICYNHSFGGTVAVTRNLTKHFTPGLFLRTTRAGYSRTSPLLCSTVPAVSTQCLVTQGDFCINIRVVCLTGFSNAARLTAIL